MFSRTGAAAIKLDLRNTQAICAHLGHPQKKIKTLHVAGTNGKGSVSHMLAAIFQKHGYKTGLYTSPHLRDFRERIRINGVMIPKEYVTGFVVRNKDYAALLQPSFFELTFGMALEYFAQEGVDIAIIETGLGGRLDSTNVITPDISVITNIGFDHMDLLGDTLSKIAGEKAGIIKRQVPVVIGESNAETDHVFIERAKRLLAPIVFADRNFEATSAVVQDGFLQVQVHDRAADSHTGFSLDLTGAYQVANLLTVIAAVRILQQNWNLQPAIIQEALSMVRELTGFQGRWQVLHNQPLVVIDVAHNPSGVNMVMTQLAQLTYRQLHIVTGMVKDKDVNGVLPLLPHDARYYFSNAHIPRALPANELKDKAADFGLSGEVFDDVNEAIRSAMSHAAADDLILVMGSVFLVGEVDMEALRDRAS